MLCYMYFIWYILANVITVLYVMRSFDVTKV